MIISFWNIRGFNKPLKQNGILKFMRRNKVSIMGVLETKLSQHYLDEIARKKFRVWKTENNFQLNPNGRILVFWKEDRVLLEVIEKTDQIIHCLVTCKISAKKFHLSFVYAFNSRMGRRPLWDNICRFNSSSGMPWMLMGDFNNILSIEEKANGIPATSYEMRDFKNCCYEAGISDLRSSGVYFTWTNNSIWKKLDRVMVNKNWVHEGLQAQARFDFPGNLSDHSPCTVSLFDEEYQGATPFKFFNMWAKHDKFLEIVSNTWRMHLMGTDMYKFCRKLKAVKDPLKDLNKQHFSLIAARAEAAEEELKRVQQQLHDSP